MPALGFNRLGTRMLQSCGNTRLAAARRAMDKNSLDVSHDNVLIICLCDSCSSRISFMFLSDYPESVVRACLDFVF